ncbi:MAG: DUF4345 family protein [Gammaproteobacteria bacterium]
MIVTGLVALAFGAMGVVALAQPVRVTTLLGVAAPAALLRNEVRAVYGGFGVAMAAVLLWSCEAGDLGRGVRYAVAAALGGMCAGRVAAWCVESAGPWPRVFAAVEAAGAMTLAFAD